MAEEKHTSYVVNFGSLPEKYPTHAHDVSFWESLGRTVATFGFLEEVLAKAIFSFTATCPYKEDEIQDAYDRWLPTLEHALTDTLRPLIAIYEKSVRDYPNAAIDHFDDLLEDLRNVSEFRNILCHGSWRPPDSAGAAYPFFVDRKKRVFDGSFDIHSLDQLQNQVANLACMVISTVTHMGWQFPGSKGPGRVIWDVGPPT
ncbi:MAG: hypothetical protein IPP78_15710 [Holophagaceae bacterium]|nr:hypothetical protein [Holophagaceae bacterium]